jgi:hypothetical protein
MVAIAACRSKLVLIRARKSPLFSPVMLFPFAGAKLAWQGYLDKSDMMEIELGK